MKHFKSVRLHFIDLENGNYIDRLSEVRPSIVVVDAEYNKDNYLCTLSELLPVNPRITVLRLKTEEDDVQDITIFSCIVEGA